jgi:hypothetical protein
MALSDCNAAIQRPLGREPLKSSWFIRSPQHAKGSQDEHDDNHHADEDNQLG